MQHVPLQPTDRETERVTKRVKENERERERRGHVSLFRNPFTGRPKFFHYLKVNDHSTYPPRLVIFAVAIPSAAKAVTRVLRHGRNGLFG